MMKTVLVILLIVGISRGYLIHQVDQSKCNGCGMCVAVCNYGAATMTGSVACIDPAKCMYSNGCSGGCYYHCHNIPAGGDAIYKTNYTGISGDDIEVLISVSPSPCRGQLVVAGAPAGDPITVHNLAGREMISAESQNETTVLNTSILPTGTYLILINGEFLTMLSVIE